MSQTKRERCTSGKRAFATYSEALAALEGLRERGVLRGPFGSVYTWRSCGELHISARSFPFVKRRGRGKARRGLLEDIS